MHTLYSHVAKFDWLLLGAVFCLIILGIITLFSLSGVSVFPFFERQLYWIVLGVAAMIGVSFIDFRLFRTQSMAVLLLYLFAVLLLLGLLLGGSSVRGVESWFRAGFFSFQPVELAKIALLILLAKFFSKRHVEIYRVEHLFVSALYVGIPALLVLLQPDLGSAMILGVIWLSIVIFSGIKLRHLFVLLILAFVLAAASWQWTLVPYQKSRITAFLNPYADPRGAAYQMLQSMIAVGSGKIWGKGIGYGSQTHLHFLPEAETDFIFAAYAEEWGLAGITALILILFLLLWRIARISMHASDNFSRLYALGFGAMIFAQATIHIGMNMGMFPITGLTLPFVSYGGSSLVMLLVGVGILQNIKINSRREIE